MIQEKNDIRKTFLISQQYQIPSINLIQNKFLNYGEDTEKSIKEENPQSHKVLE